MTLLHIQKARSNEKSEQESNLSEMLITLERKYQSKIIDMNESNQRLMSELEEKNKKLEREVKKLTEKITLETFNKLGSKVITEKKVNELIENEKKYITEIETLKIERDSKISEYQRLIENERENMKSK